MVSINVAVDPQMKLFLIVLLFTVISDLEMQSRKKMLFGSLSVISETRYASKLQNMPDYAYSESKPWLTTRDCCLVH